MPDNKAKEKIKKLTDLIDKWNQEYYDLDAPTVSDFEYDEAFIELEALEAAFPEFKLPNSPTNRIGASVDNRFQKVVHDKQMLSLNKAYSFNEVKKYIDNIKKKLEIEQPEFFLEPKIDGLSISVKYKNGKLTQAVTRGNGVVGEDVTHNILVIDSVPKKINYSQDIEIRGEVFISKSDFETLNKIAKANGQKPFANARNAASGSLRQLESSNVKERKLQAIMYFIPDATKHGIANGDELFAFLKKNKFKTQEWNFKTNNLNLLEKMIHDYKDLKNTFSYECDGLVIKFNDFSKYDLLGKTAKFPHHSIAYKYEIEKAITKLVNIFPSVGRTGKITYNAVLEPVELNQTTVSAATLHNYDYIADNKINIGDDVYVIKAGEIIPRVIAPVEPKDRTYFTPATNCPSCNSLLGKIDENVDQYCLNENCKEKQVRSLIYFCSREAMNIEALGERALEIFFEFGLIKNIQDIFYLKDHKNEITKIHRFGKKSVENILKNIENSSHCFVYQALNGLGIKYVGLQASKTLGNVLTKLSDLYNFTYEDLTTLKDLGTKTAAEIIEFINNEKNQKLIYFLDEHLTYKQNKKVSNIFENQTFVISGTLSNPREYYKKLIEDNGGKVASSISKITNYLLLGENGGSKKDKANALGIAIITEEDLLKMMQ
ncbi:DNA ligase (NAD(+)) [Mycoplasmopsis californica]|uniref:DNA ligase n=1 Tax=Mycoplasmopsis equigenitalium TaxID=114883 RepID=A0ABY5J1P4_9BACT|nr:NAD-dependent DNA ligase LigA [Mycoplasmopsis equigenitalium]UUD37169.1 NAD-dependent DNA ligase LigA [Mycoplasmopsis equigenitalium]VEU69525.1 DNA ligase (NAD(+)) [Mycoplasmopsis californica]